MGGRVVQGGSLENCWLVAKLSPELSRSQSIRMDAMWNPIPAAFESGRAEALKDIREGKPRLFWGIRGRWGTYFSELMRERFGVLLDELSCLVTDDSASFHNGYNSEIQKYVDQRFGAGSFSQALEEVERFREKLYENWRRDESS